MGLTDGNRAARWGCPFYLSFFPPFGCEQKYGYEPCRIDNKLFTKGIYTSVISKNYSNKVGRTGILIGILNSVTANYFCACQAFFRMHEIVRIAAVGQIRCCENQNSGKNNEHEDF